MSPRHCTQNWTARMTAEFSPTYEHSAAEHTRRERIIAGGVNSNVRLAGTPVPLTFRRGDGALLWDVDGNEYVDYAGGMGPMLLGHNHPTVTSAVRSALEDGQLFAGQSPLEATFAEHVVTALPWVESIRIGLTGTEMNLLAVRIARAATGRQKVVRFVGHYHGWLDPLLIDAGAVPGSAGSAPLTRGQSVNASDDLVVCEWNDVTRVERALAGGDVACVVMEPVMCNTGLVPPQPGFLEAVRAACDDYGALLVIDEVITGFRLGLAGAQGMFGVRGDLAVYAKAIGSGFPLAVLTGTAELFAPVGRGEVNHSGTYNTGTSSLAAGVATLGFLIDEDPYRSMESVTSRLVEGLRAVGADRGLAVDFIGGTLFQTRFGSAAPCTSRMDFVERSDAARLREFVEALQHAGVRPTGRGLWFVSAAHDDAIVDRTLERVEQVLRTL